MKKLFDEKSQIKTTYVTYMGRVSNIISICQEGFLQFFDIVDFFKEIISRATGMESLETFLRYVISATDKINEQDIKEILTQKVPQGGDTIMPIIAEK